MLIFSYRRCYFLADCAFAFDIPFSNAILPYLKEYSPSKFTLTMTFLTIVFYPLIILKMTALTKTMATDERRGEKRRWSQTTSLLSSSNVRIHKDHKKVSCY